MTDISQELQKAARQMEQGRANQHWQSQTQRPGRGAPPNNTTSEQTPAQRPADPQKDSDQSAGL
ncbi:hypothetical protein J2W49_002581 [Hydrogenophaga palleronii]|uniref:Uncharacterized protein n=1 Tax=Hydrogenophaga palleronii TaxID=65655 RepID=A0ABU1WMX5_9BURK|nr:hypothetical protein [Hydrogenophaga palleronii]MDR7150618.1 hypothetical protein [Hydrogenophaga palleronii]